MSYKYRNKFGFSSYHSNSKHRVNYAIKAYSIRVIFEGQQIGVMSVDSAMKIANEKNLDLVEIAPNSKPPVCHILNYEKYLYQEKIKEKDKKKGTKLNDSKEIRFKSCIEENDLNTKINHAKEFLKDGKKVQITLKFKSNRELSHKEKGFELINKFLECIDNSIFSIEKKPFMTSNQIICKLTPKT
jgi:translation initiation factor IF-3